MSNEAQTWPDVLGALIAAQDLSAAQSRWAMNEIMTGRATQAQTAAFLVGLRAKGEVGDELAGLADVMLDAAIPLQVDGPAIDIVGTGGDRFNTVNLSTMASLVVAGAGVRVVKHGNRAASSKSGTADVLERLGVTIDLPADQVARVVAEAGITFVFARTFHPSMAYAGPVRGELGIGTTLNYLGPLTNPARPGYAAIGCADLRMAPLMADVLARRGTTGAVFRGQEGLDEVSIAGPTDFWLVRNGNINPQTVRPGDLGLDEAPLSAIVGDTPEVNAQHVRDLLDGKTGPIRDAVLLNAGYAIAVTDTETAEQEWLVAYRRGVERANESLDSGAAKRVLERWVEASTPAVSTP